MPVTLAAGDLIEVKTFCHLQAQTAINVWHYLIRGVVGTSLTDQQVVSSLSTLAGPIYRAWMANTAAYDGMRLQRLLPAPAPVYVTSLNQAGFGAIAGDSLPPQNAIVVSKRSNLAGRNNRGRVYLPFWAEQFGDANGKLTVAGEGLAAAWANQFMAAITVANAGNSVTMDPIVFNRSTGGSVFITNSRIPIAFATQRRRSQINRGDALGP